MQADGKQTMRWTEAAAIKKLKRSAEQILHLADEMNALPWKQLEYKVPEEFFDEFLDKAYLKIYISSLIRYFFNLLLKFTWGAWIWVQ